MKQNDAMIGGFRILKEIHGGGHGRAAVPAAENTARGDTRPPAMVKPE